MTKFTILLKRKFFLTPEEFRTYQSEQHAPLFCSIPAVQQSVRRYVQQHTIPATHDSSNTRFR